ncbi:hypothetical protein JB92DRAFT_2704249 [Gautieria morchelliformis]|nr:hypothetical protein JB92DRAFT_2704249 [Gautieria morchelliformis]
MIPSLEREKQQAPRGSIDLGDGYLLLRARDRHARDCDGLKGEVIEAYIRKAEEELGSDMPEAWKLKVVRWSRVLLPTAQIACSDWKECAIPIHKSRRAKCVKLIVHEQIEFADVIFYFRLNIGDKTRSLALVTLYSRPDAFMLEESLGAVYSITKLDENVGMKVVDIKSIKSVVSIQPHPYFPPSGEESFFVWEKIGLEMMSLADAGEEIPDDG